MERLILNIIDWKEYTLTERPKECDQCLLIPQQRNLNVHPFVCMQIRVKQYYLEDFIIWNIVSHFKIFIRICLILISVALYSNYTDQHPMGISKQYREQALDKT